MSKFRKSPLHMFGWREAQETSRWLPSAFTFELGSLPCKRVSKIDAFTIKQTFVKDRVGKFCKATKHPGQIEYPDLTFYLSMADAEAWEAWFKSFVIDGKCADGDELDGQITILGPDHSEVLGRIELRHCGIFSLRPAAVEANTEAPARLEVEIYVEEMKLFFDHVDAWRRDPPATEWSPRWSFPSVPRWRPPMARICNPRQGRWNPWAAGGGLTASKPAA